MEDLESTTPITKLKKKLSPTKINIVLMFGGAFYPIHINHIRTLEVAIQYV